MSALLAITPRAQAAWVRARAEFRVELRRPEPDETPLSDEEIWHGIRFGVFDGADGDERVFVLERRGASVEMNQQEGAANARR